jgi:hypothetical protein
LRADDSSDVRERMICELVQVLMFPDDARELEELSCQPITFRSCMRDPLESIEQAIERSCELARGTVTDR